MRRESTLSKISWGHWGDEGLGKGSEKVEVGMDCVRSKKNGHI